MSETVSSGLPVGSTMYLAGDWLGNVTDCGYVNLLDTNAINYDNNLLNTSTNVWHSGYNWIQPTYYWPYYTRFEREKVRLKLSEVETLREVARDNSKVRDVLNKLSHLIEIEVDF